MQLCSAVAHAICLARVANAASTLLDAATLLAYADIESGGAVCFIKDLGSRNKVGTLATNDDKDAFADMAS
jgi:hypothetical protein